MTIHLEAGYFVALCDDNPQCFYNGIREKRHTAQTQEPLSIDLAPPADPDEALHANDGAKAKKASATQGLSKIEKKQLDRFVENLRREGWIVTTDRSRPMGIGTICKNHNPATVHPRPPPDLDW